MPSIGFKARLAIPVLKDIEVMSRIAVPLVSDPVPAVVGTVSVTCRQANHNEVRDTSMQTCNERTQLLSHRETLAYRRVNEIEEIRVLVHRKPAIHE